MKEIASQPLQQRQTNIHPREDQITQQNTSEKNKRFLPRYRYGMLDPRGHIDVIPRDMGGIRSISVCCQV
jgi:hypothetical protein